ncbi:hypothetical protein [Candidatus Thiodictyon syntrophicum]|jgi:hypothetical protein|uniref:Cytosolic protein n=1 Tax=Candidatus Thiodictyon syntrophicum TaxID=1166950 RepID=A0A2K8UA14_9GAMM|nr:hypothetical protein [Candidatus Thiodictyon syntrophicum]AUB82430.1 hypothetical protein THSYN_16760 [Candidatus Thiodictyon syntrophicum]
MTENPAANPEEPGTPDYDSPWKEAIDAWLPPFMALFFPTVHALIDWDRPYEFLDAELQRITGDSTIGRRYADRLVKVYSREGLEVWLLLHIEIQGQAEAGFPERMFQYWYRIYDRFGGIETISLALLTNDRADGETTEYRRERDGCGVRFRFRVHTLLSWDEADLAKRAADNPFAVVALAQLAAHRRSSNPERKARKGEIIALLYRYRYGRDDAIKLLRFIDWLIRLPRGLELALRQELAELEEQTKMSYVTSWERFAREEGLEQGRREGWQAGRQEGWQAGQQEGWQAGQQEGEAKALLRLLQAKFGPPTPDLVARVQAGEPDQIEAWLTRILTADSPHEVFDTH